MSLTHAIDIVGGEQANHLSQVVRGEIRIDVGDATKEHAIEAIYRAADIAAYELLTGEQWRDPKG